MNHLGDTNKMVGEDHIRDATKMVSETPRTDRVLKNCNGWHHVPIELARELERELNAASKQRDDALMMLGMYRMKSDEQRQRIKRLEEAGDKIVEAGWSVQDWSGMCVVWAKAKEDKL